MVLHPLLWRRAWHRPDPRRRPRDHHRAVRARRALTARSAPRTRW